MTQALKNIIEIIETDNEYENALNKRSTNIKNFSILGPTDLCYLTKEYQKSLTLSKRERIGTYHYVYGFNMNNPACMSTYIQNMLKYQEAELNWFSNGKWIIVKGVYCLYDAFNKIDIRAEVKFPGGIKLLAINKDGEKIAIDENKWDTAYVSSILRAIYPESAPAVKFYKVFPTYNAWNDFARVVINLVKNGIDLDYPSHEQLLYRGNRVVHSIVDYLMKKRRLNVCVEFLNQIIQIDSRYIAFLADAFSFMNKIPESIRLLSPILQNTPHVTNLLYIEAQSLMRCEQYEMALKLTKVVVQLNPDSFDAWLLLIEIFFYCKHYSEALVAINIAPTYPKREYNNGYTDINPKNITKPKTRNTSDNFGLFMFEPSSESYRSTQFNEELAFLQGDFQEENERAVLKIKNLVANTLNDQELKLYRVLVKIEREIGWDKLLLLRSQLFLMENDTHLNQQNMNLDQISVRKLEDYDIYNASIMLDESAINFVPALSMNENSFYMIKAGGEKIIEQKILEEYHESDDSDDGKYLPSFLRVNNNDEDSPGIIQKKHNGKKGDNNIEYLSLNDYENQKDNPNNITEEVEPITDTDYYNEKFKNFSLKNKKYLGDRKIFTQTQQKFDSNSIINLNIKSKRICSKLVNKLFMSLYEDLTTLYEWQNEENNKKNPLYGVSGNNGNNGYGDDPDDDNIKFGGLLWVYRGILAERLCRIRYAERAYRKAIERGCSIYAWSRLYGMYMESGALRAALICLAEILDEMEMNNIQAFTIIPDWLSNPIHQTISQIGILRFRALLEEMNWEDEMLKVVLQEGKYWETEGWSLNTNRIATAEESKDNMDSSGRNSNVNKVVMQVELEGSKQFNNSM